MTTHANQRTSVSTLMGASITAPGGRTLGSVREFAVLPSEDTSHIFGVMVRLAGKTGSQPSLIRIADLLQATSGTLELRHEVEPTEVTDSEAYLLIDRDMMDQQIIDVNGHRVVRVNDVDLIWEACHDGPEGTSVDGRLSLRIAEVEVGIRGAVRRLLKGLPHSTIDRLTSRLPASVIPWEFVDLIDRDPSRRVKLKIAQNRLATMHPSDIAGILEELAPAERDALFTSLDEEMAAEALEEVDPWTQRALVESLDSERVAGIVEEMDPGAAADFLSELSDERSAAILEEMDQEERDEVEELLEFDEDSAAGRMTTDYLALPATALISDAIAALNAFEGDTDAVSDILLLNDRNHVHAVVPVVRLLLAPADGRLEDLPHSHIVTCPADASGKKVAEFFDKYNLRSLPVVDEECCLLGVIHAEQVISLLRNKH